MERFFDVVFSSLALAFLLPVLLPVIIILRLTGEGEVFFLQERVGKNGRKFKLMKFATMLKNSPSIGTGTVTMKDDPRVLPVGKVLRKTKINELPQLINIFVGEMSVIGPRPLTSQTFAAYSPETQDTVQAVRPGLSGIGSIIFRGEEEIMQGDLATLNFYGDVIAPYKGALEEWFVAHKGLYLYFATIVLTIWVIVVPSRQLAWRVFSDLPEPPDVLKPLVNYTR